ncbi:MAG: MobF family relaxase, partial [Acidimicrobiales bacterium]
MLTLTELRDAEYVISSVALGVDEYYAGIGEAPGVWAGRFAPALGLEGVVDAEDLRALVDGHHPRTGVDLLAGRRKRKVHVFDATFSPPKSVSTLWGLGSPETAAVVSRAHTEALVTALSFLEDQAAVARQQTKGVRRRVPTAGFAVAGFFHRTSREGDPQLHTHCLIANLVRRPDGTHVAFDGNPLHDWAKAAGTVYQAELQRLLTQELGVAWGPDRNNTREMVGIDRKVLRAFSKRSVAIEAELEAQGAVYESPAARMRADDAASLATRPAKDHSLTPALLVERWRDEARELGIDSAASLEAAVGGRPGPAPLSAEQVTAALLDPEEGLCARSARFTEAQVVAQVAALSAGRWTTAEIAALAGDFIASEHVVRLVPADQGRRRPPEWSTVAHRTLEDAVLARLGELAARPCPALDPEAVEAAIEAEGRLGADQAGAVRALCGPGTGLRSVVAPAGFGKTTTVHAAAAACTAAGRPVLGVATTNQAVAGLRSVGLEAATIARLRLDLEHRPLAPGTVVVLDEVSQVCTRDAACVADAVAATPEASLWCLGDPRQAPAVGAGGLGAEVARLGAEGAIVAPALSTNRRQRHAGERAALDEL